MGSMNPLFVTVVTIFVTALLISVQAEKSKGIKYHTATINIHYPSKNLCSNCHINFASSLDWNGYYPETKASSNNVIHRAHQIDNDLYSANVTFSDNKVGELHVLSVYYSAINANASDRQWLNNHCRTVLNSKVGATNKGSQYIITLGDTPIAATYHLYPYFCKSQGETRAVSVTADAEFGYSRTIHYYVPASLLENPLPREINYLLQMNGFPFEYSTKLIYDFSIEHGLIPEVIVFGPEQGLPEDPWNDLDQTYYEMTPYRCTGSYYAEDCRNKSGGGFSFLSVILNGMYSINTELSLPPVNRDLLSIAGHSMAGLDACLYAYVNSSVFSKAYCGSPAFWYNDNIFAKIVADSDPTHKIKLFIDVGMREEQYISDAVTTGYQSLLDKKAHFTLGSNLMYLNYNDAPDSHQWNSWIRHYPIALAFLYNDGQDIASTRTPLYRNVVYGEPSRPFTIGTRFKVSMLSVQQDMGANPYQ